MLTKEERTAIAERASSYNDDTFYFTDIYKCLFGEEVPDITSEDEDTTRVIGCLVDLCDTSNMLELSVDKDGEVIHIGDVLFNESSGKSYRAGGYDYDTDGCAVVVFGSNSRDRLYLKPDEFTHKKPVTIASLASDIKRVANQGQVDRKVYEELFNIAWALEKLGDSDDD